MKVKAVSLGIIIAVISTAAVISLSSFKPQDQAARFATLKTYEYAAVFDSKIVIIYEDGKTEEIELEKSKSLEKMISNAQKINESMNYMSKKGYRLVSVSHDQSIATVIFEKK